jgi:hypothetical protein
LKILGYAYTVREDKALQDNHNLFGQQKPVTLEITYSGNVARQMQESAVLHEIIEAINYHLQLGLKHQAIMGIETGLYGTLTDAGIDLSRLLP